MPELIGQIIVFGLISPVIAVPAFLFGYLVRRWWLVPIAAIVIAAVFVILGMLDSERSADSEIVWAAVPVSVLPPLLWCIVGFYVGRWRRRRGVAAAGFARAASIIAALLLGAVGGAAAGLGLGLAYVELAHVSSFEGMAGYMVVYLFGFPGLIIGGIIGAIIGSMINRRLSARQASPA